MEEATPFTLLGVMLILLGVVFVALPYISRVVDIEKIPWVIIYVYRSDGFVFATSPLLIILSLLSLALAYLRR